MTCVPIDAVSRKAIREDDLAPVQREPAEPVEGAQLVGRGLVVRVGESDVSFYRGEFDVSGEEK